MHSDWLKLVVRLVTSNQIALFKIRVPSYGITPMLFDYWVDPVVHLLLLKSSMT